MRAAVAAAIGVLVPAASAAADVFPPDQTKGFEIEAKLLNANTFQFSTVDAYKYKPGSDSGTPEGVNIVCEGTNGEVERVTVGPLSASPEFHPGTISGLASVKQANENSRRATGTLNISASDAVSKDVATVTGSQVTDNRIATLPASLLSGGFTIKMTGPFTEGGTPGNMEGTVTCTTSNPFAHFPLTDFESEHNDKDSSEVS
jgi:hypothetical protein